VIQRQFKVERTIGTPANHVVKLNFVNRLNFVAPAYMASNEKVLHY
jgi:hypothetical protein